MTQQVVRVLDQVEQLAVALHLFQVFALMAQQGVVQLESGGEVDDVPERRPAVEATGFHVRED